MKINGINRIAGIYKNNMNKKTKEVKKTKGKDSLELSSVAKDYQKAIEAGKNIPDVRMEKIDELKSKMLSNNYNIKGEEVAKKMVESGFDLTV